MTDESEKQFSADLESFRIEFQDKLNAIIDKFLKSKFGDTLGDKISRDSKMTIEISVKQRNS